MAAKDKTTPMQQGGKPGSGSGGGASSVFFSSGRALNPWILRNPHLAKMR